MKILINIIFCLTLNNQFQTNKSGSINPPIKNSTKFSSTLFFKQQQNEQYIIYNNGTVEDIKTGLIWKRCPEGLSGINCSIGEAIPYSWYNAKKFKNTDYAGYSDWRLPTINELRTLVYCGNGTLQKTAWYRGCTKDWSDAEFKHNPYQRPTINQKAFPNTSSNTHLNNWRPYRYWSSSAVDGIFYAWWLSFKYGHDNFDIRAAKYFIRLVRIKKLL